MKKNEAEAILKKAIDALTVQQLILAWDETVKHFDFQTSPILRGAIMERMEREHPEKYAIWCETSEGDEIASVLL